VKIAARVVIAAALLTGVVRADATPPMLDRVVAVVDKSPILLSEVRVRARPLASQLTASGEKMTDEKVRELHRQLVERIIDERIIEQEAEKRQLTVTPDEVEKGIASIAETNKISKEAIEAEVERLGMTKEQYRDEVRRQIVEGKWLQLTIRPRLRDVPSDPKAYMELLMGERVKELKRLRAAHYIEVRP
jgi:peptidyl-prolyl cis-trans isomerase SurA